MKCLIVVCSFLNTDTFLTTIVVTSFFRVSVHFTFHFIPLLLYCKERKTTNCESFIIVISINFYFSYYYIHLLKKIKKYVAYLTIYEMHNTI